MQSIHIHTHKPYSRTEATLNIINDIPIQNTLYSHIQNKRKYERKINSLNQHCHIQSFDHKLHFGRKWNRTTNIDIVNILPIPLTENSNFTNTAD